MKRKDSVCENRSMLSDISKVVVKRKTVKLQFTIKTGAKYNERSIK